MSLPSPPVAPDDPTVRSVRRALAILRAFGPEDRGLPLGEIARRAGLDKATARRLLRTLIGERLMRQDLASKDYALDIGMLELAAGATPADATRRRVQPKLAALVTATGTSAFLLLPHEAAVLCIEALHGAPPCRAPRAPGERMALHADAASRVLMAHLALETRMALLAGPLPGARGAAATDPFQLSTRLDTIRQRDWDCAVGEVAAGVAVLAVPVRHAGAVVAALAIAAPAAALLDGEAPRHMDTLRGFAWEMEHALAPPKPAGRRTG